MRLHRTASQRSIAERRSVPGSVNIDRQRIEVSSFDAEGIHREVTRDVRSRESARHCASETGDAAS